MFLWRLYSEYRNKLNLQKSSNYRDYCARAMGKREKCPRTVSKWVPNKKHWVTCLTLIQSNKTTTKLCVFVFEKKYVRDGNGRAIWKLHIYRTLNKFTRFCILFQWSKNTYVTHTHLSSNNMKSCSQQIKCQTFSCYSENNISPCCCIFRFIHSITVTQRTTAKVQRNRRREQKRRKKMQRENVASSARLCTVVGIDFLAEHLVNKCWTFSDIISVWLQQKKKNFLY